MELITHIWVYSEQKAKLEQILVIVLVQSFDEVSFVFVSSTLSLHSENLSLSLFKS